MQDADRFEVGYGRTFGRHTLATCRPSEYGAIDDVQHVAFAASETMYLHNVRVTDGAQPALHLKSETPETDADDDAIVARDGGDEKADVDHTVDVPFPIVKLRCAPAAQDVFTVWAPNWSVPREGDVYVSFQVRIA